jgi:lysophospholipase L1-like esterase
LNLKRILCTIELLLLITSVSFCQSDSIWQQAYPFLRTEANTINNHQALSGFFARLDSLERGEIRQVKIVHIGDSHIQADFFSGEIRRLMQQRYGNAGRGFVFPYKAARTNGPGDYTSGSYGNWESRRMVIASGSPAIGIGGITLSSSDSNSLLFLSIKENEPKNQLFDKVTVFRQPGMSFFDLGLGTQLPVSPSAARTVEHSGKHTVKAGESLGLIARRYQTSVPQLKKWNSLRSDLIRPGQILVVGITYKSEMSLQNESYNDVFCIPSETPGQGVTCLLPELSGSLYLRNLPGSPLQKNGIIYGLSLENSREKGILYHSIGVNGAQYVHYNQAEYFSGQLSTLSPDLVIISLGTNEAFARDLTEEQLYQAIDSLVSRLSAENPEACFILSTQPDSYLKRKYKNARNMMIRETIAGYADARYTGLWDLNTVMGGYGSISDWLQNGLSSKDKVHFSAAGYRLQGQLFFNALMKSYEHYRAAGSE